MRNPGDVYIEDNHVVLQVTEHYFYDIPMRQLRTKEDVLRWAEHLSEKNWCDSGMLDRFIDVAKPKPWDN